DRLAFSRLGDPGEDLEEGALASSVRSDDADDFPTFHLEGDVPESPEGLLPCAFFGCPIGKQSARFLKRQDRHVNDRFPQRLVGMPFFADAILLTDTINADCHVAHVTSPINYSVCHCAGLNGARPSGR